MPSTLRGAFLVVLATALFVTMNSAVKYLGAHLPTVELIWARTLAHLIFMVALFAPAHGGWRLFVTRRPGLQLGRSLLLLVSTSLFFTALRYVPLTEATAVSFTSPLMVALLAGWALGERVGRVHWLAIALGFVGALMVIRPGVGAINPYLFFVVGIAQSPPGLSDSHRFVELELRRVAGRSCGAVKRERLDFLAGNACYRKRFAFYGGLLRGHQRHRRGAAILSGPRARSSRRVASPEGATIRFDHLRSGLRRLCDAVLDRPRLRSRSRLSLRPLHSWRRRR